MLTDIFADRYSTTELWKDFGESERRLIVQGFRIIKEQICPYWIDGKKSKKGELFWTDLHDRLSMELGVTSLSDKAYSYLTKSNGKSLTVSGTRPIITVCKNWMLKPFDASALPDRFIKERLSFVEIAFRKREIEIADTNANLPKKILAAKRTSTPRSGTIRLPGDPVKGVIDQNERMNALFRSHVEELNTRFRQAACDLNYHNGFIQLSTDELSLKQIETPFWALVSNPKWKNVDIDMKEAIDRRDTNARDSAFYAARALESALKIVSNENGWSNGKERGASNFIEKLASKDAAFLTDWESDALKLFFGKVRNPLGHGPGEGQMPTLSQQQTDWAIDTSMAWIKSIIRRM